MESLYSSQTSKSPELVIGLISPIGANLKLVVEVIEEELSKFQYSCETIRVSALLHSLPRYKYLSGLINSEYERIIKHMEAGTELRTETSQGDVMALFAASKIRNIRKEKNIESGNRIDPERMPRERTAYILRSLKHPDEIESLRDIYGDAFVTVSAYSPRAERVEFLSQVLAKSDNSFDYDKYRSQAEKLINIDEEEEGNKLGQDVSDAFPLADLFVDARSKVELQKNISRFLDAYFGYPFSTPTKDEFAMFFAKATALRSADLARQVGAAITDQDGDLISVGCNEVPRAGGGLYWSENTDDARDYQIGYDTSAKYKNDILSELLSKLKENGWLSDIKAQLDVNDLLEEATKKSAESLSNTQVMSIIEYGRSVHAEMAAITDAAKRGLSVKSGKLYCTTFPCHLCARHIVSSGIEKVIYIEPYPKSQAKKLYPDSIETDPSSNVLGKVIFEPFVGISPNKYIQLFSMSNKRKNKNGDVVDWDKSCARPDIKRFALSYLLAEDTMIGERLANILESNSEFLDKTH